MRKSKFTESQIVAILTEGDAGLPVAEICRKHGISNALYYQWKSKYSGVTINELKREALRIEIGRSITAARVVRIMDELIEVYGAPKAIRLHNGAELTSYAFTEWAEQHGVELRFIQPGKPNQNAFIERFNKSFRQEILDANLFNTLSEVQELADEWLNDYNEYRPHESLGNLPPAVFKSRVFKSDVSTLEL